MPAFGRRGLDWSMALGLATGYRCRAVEYDNGLPRLRKVGVRLMDGRRDSERAPRGAVTSWRSDGSRDAAAIRMRRNLWVCSGSDGRGASSDRFA